MLADEPLYHLDVDVVAQDLIFTQPSPSIDDELFGELAAFEFVCDPPEDSVKARWCAELESLVWVGCEGDVEVGMQLAKLGQRFIDEDWFIIPCALVGVHLVHGERNRIGQVIIPGRLRILLRLGWFGICGCDWS